MSFFLLAIVSFLDLRILITPFGIFWNKWTRYTQIRCKYKYVVNSNIGFIHESNKKNIWIIKDKIYLPSHLCNIIRWLVLKQDINSTLPQLKLYQVHNKLHYVNMDPYYFISNVKIIDFIYIFSISSIKFYVVIIRNILIIMMPLITHDRLFTKQNKKKVPKKHSGIWGIDPHARTDVTDTTYWFIYLIDIFDHIKANKSKLINNYWYCL